jgi:AcrR family transcriptional regulator
MTVDQRKLKGDETKSNIIQAAISIVAVEGTNGLSAKKISDIVGISKSNVFHHFGSVDGIMEEIMDGISASYLEPTKPGDYDSLEVFFQTLGSMTFDLKEEELVHYKVLYAFYNDMMFQEKFKNQMSEVKLSFAEYLKDSIYTIEKIRIHQDLAEIIAIDLDGLGLHYLIELDSEKFLRLWCIKSKIYIDEIRK